MAHQAMATAAGVQLRGSTWTDVSQSPTSTCDSGKFGNLKDSNANGGYTEEWYCKRITDVFDSAFSPDGYWIVTNTDGAPLGELLSSHDKCYYGVTRIESHGWEFKWVGEEDVVNFFDQAIDQIGSGQLHGGMETMESSAEGGDKDSALIAFESSSHL